MRTRGKVSLTIVKTMIGLFVSIINAGCEKSPDVPPTQTRVAANDSEIKPAEETTTEADHLSLNALLDRLRQLQADVSVQSEPSGPAKVEIDLGLSTQLGEALRCAARVPNVVRLSLQGARLEAGDWRQFEKLAALRYLDLSDTSIQDADLAALEKMPELEFLLLWNTAISDAGLAHLAGLKRLQKLDLSVTKITGARLKQLASLERLQELYLEVPSIDERAVRELQQHLPHTLIVH